jgi:glutamine amidotransferase
MRRLREKGLTSLLKTLSQPVLGICLGMQIFYERSDEAHTECLGILPHTVRELSPSAGLRVPHMGWNTLESVSPDPLLEGIHDGEFVYYVHSYAVPPTNTTVAHSDYGQRFSAVVHRDNFWGTQFHPERSADVGARVLQNFLRL